MTRSETVAADVAALLRARNPLLWVVTREEARVERYLIEAAAAAGYATRFWDAAQGVTNVRGDVESFGSTDADQMLDTIGARAKAGPGYQTDRCVWVMRDLPVWLTPPIGIIGQRRLRNLARLLPGVGRDNAQAVVVLTPSSEVPRELAGHATVIEWPLPDREEIGDLLDASVGVMGDAAAAALPDREGSIDAAVGLTGEEAQACFARSLVQSRRVDPVIVAGEKKRIVAREGVLEWFDPLPGGLDSVGGLDNLKTWLMERSAAYSPAARAYGLPQPKGAFLAGISGCGKSLSAKAAATAWNVPLLRLDLGALKSKFVGDSEQNLRRAFRVIEAIGRCVVWIDEIEKAMQGATSGSADGGVSADALGAVLSWMQDRAGAAFVIATANDISKLPPELMRKGRFDELWFIDLPNVEERKAILSVTLRKNGRAGADIALDTVAARSEGFTGSEVSELVTSALFAGFGDGTSPREIETADLVDAARQTVPLSQTAEETIRTMREWAKTRARLATAQTAANPTRTNARAIDL